MNICKSKIRRRVPGREKLHHPMLHEKSERQAETHVTGALFSRSVCSTSQVLPRIVPVILYGPVGEFKTYALLDEASTVTLITQSAADVIGAKGKRDVLKLQELKRLAKEIGNIGGNISDKAVIAKIVSSSLRRHDALRKAWASAPIGQ